MVGRNAFGSLSGVLEHLSFEAVTRFNAVGTFRVTLKFSPEVWAQVMQPRSGLVFYRDGLPVFSGTLRSPSLSASAEDQSGTVTVIGDTDETVLADTLVYPNPLAAGNAQSTVSHWTATGPAETVLLNLIDAQIGSTAQAARKVTGLVVAGSQGRGATVTPLIRYGTPDLLAEVARIALEGGDLGFRVRYENGQRVVSVFEPSNVQGRIRFGMDLGNLESFDYTVTAPTVTYAIAAGQGQLAARVQRQHTGSAANRLWDRREVYVDRRDTADTAELDKAALKATREGSGTAQVTMQVIDGPVARYGVDYDLGDRVTVYIGPPGYSDLGQITDLVREISFEDGPDGEVIRPAVGPPGTQVFNSWRGWWLRQIGARLAVVERGQ